MLLCIAISAKNKENRAKLRKIDCAGNWENAGKGLASLSMRLLRPPPPVLSSR